MIAAEASPRDLQDLAGEGVGASILPLQIWLSPGFPIGAFAFSHGLEQAVEAGWIQDAVTLRVWLEGIVAQGAIRTDAVLLAAAWRAGQRGDMDAALEANALALALAPSQERHLETSAQGNAFLSAVLAAWPAAGLRAFAAALGEADVAYPVVTGLCAAAHGIALRPTLAAASVAALSNLVSAAVRLGPIGQSDGQAILSALCPALDALAHWAEGTGLADCGSTAWSADIASMRHETQYSRLFRS